MNRTTKNKGKNLKNEQNIEKKNAKNQCIDFKNKYFFN